MKLSVMLLPLLLTGCISAAPKFPGIPPELQNTCPELSELNLGSEKMTDLLGVVSVNYKTYYECRVRVEAWQSWYNTQKKIFDAAK